MDIFRYVYTVCVCDIFDTESLERWSDLHSRNLQQN